MQAVLAELPTGPGVYRFRDGQGRALYIGRAVNLRRRVRSYWGDLGDRRHLRRMVPQIVEIEATECASEHEAAWLERNLLSTTLPRWNRTPGGAEVEVFIRLDLGRRIGLHLAHDRGIAGDTKERRYFGPYLGGRRAKDAISGLQRVVPLHAASPALSAAERDLLLTRGIELGGLDRNLATIIAILNRDPSAAQTCLDDLARLRDLASAKLAYEQAGKINEEIGAVNWLLGEQRVSTLDAESYPIHGWSHGVLLSYEMHQGRVQTWSSRIVSRSAADPWLTLTPPQWAAFAQHNADLAGRLRAARLR